MAAWRNIKQNDNETLDEFSYRATQLGKALGLNAQHILDTFKLGLPSNIYVNLVHIDGMHATLNMAPDLAYGPVVVKMKSQREDCLPQMLRVALVNGKIHLNVTNTGQGELHIYKG